MMTGVELFKLEQFRRSKETAPQQKTFVALNGNEIGVEINWDDKTFCFFLFKDKRKNRIMETKHIPLETRSVYYRELIWGLFSEYYKTIDKDPDLPMYTKMELGIYVSHLHYHAMAKTLPKVLEKQVIY